MDGQRFDEDAFGQAPADTQPRVTDLADNIGVSAQKFDSLFFAKTHLAKSRPDLGSRGKLPDANDLSRLDPAQRANKRSGALAFQNHISWRLFVQRAPK